MTAQPRKLIIGIGLFAVPLSFGFRAPADPAPGEPVKGPATSAAKQPTNACDARITRLKRFLAGLHCPVKDLAAEFVTAADENHLDWRLLPSISVIESGGGKACKNNNIFGWNRGLDAFESVRSGIQEVAFRLGRGRLYRNRDVIGKLKIYNPNSEYAESVMTVMNRISPTPTISSIGTPRNLSLTPAYNN